MEYYKYKCKNVKCTEKFKEKRGCEKICPLCGTETIVYRIKYQKHIPMWYQVLFMVILMFLVVCIAGYVYLQFFSGEPIFPISIFEEVMIDKKYKFYFNRLCWII